MRKRIVTIVLCFVMFFLSLAPADAKSDKLNADGLYHVVNVDKKGQYEIIRSFDTYAEAKVSHTMLRTKYNNLGITLGDIFLTIDQGVVSFDASADCSVNTDYTLADGNGDGYLNACYGNDAAFLEYNTATNGVKFRISGVTGWVDASKMTLYPLETLPSVSSFIVKEDVLYHRLKSQATSGAYANTIALSKAPSYLKEKTTYYSYDSHYFYTSYKQMINDYRDGTYMHAVNAKQPYYNYYQYMDHRSTSSYTPKQLDSYFKDTLALNDTITDFYDRDNYVHDILTQSLLFQGSDAFFQYQNQFGANALMMLSLSLNESAIGKSYIAYTKNNLFGHAAFDSSAEESASRYASVAASVYSHALHYISKSYLNPDAFQFYGGFFGNKAGGMNVAYASDPYWGEKAASYYYKIDSSMGSKDNNQYALGISEGKSVNIYKTASTKSDVLYATDAGYDSSFILLEKVKNKSGTWYRIQSDMAFDASRKKLEDGTYPFKYSYGYVRAKDLNDIQNIKKIDAKNYVNITFDAKDGSFYPDTKTITMQVENGSTPVVLDPVKENALFNGWDIELGPAKTNLTYNATYKAVKNIQLIKKPTTKYNVGDTLNLKNGKIRVNFKDGKSKDVKLTSDMVSGYQSDVKGKQTLTITYAGSTAHYEINVSDSLDEKKQELLDRAAYIIKTYSGKSSLNQEAQDELIRFRDDVTAITTTPVLNRDQIRVIDRILQENLDPRYSVIINDDTYDLQTSGLALALQGEQNFLNSIMPKTIRINVDDEIDTDEEELVDKVAKANNMNIAAYVSIDGSDDFSSLKPQWDMAFSIKKPAGNTKYRSYKVYYIDGKDVYELPTSQSASRIQFTSSHLGSFAIVYQNVDSVKENEDISEVNTIALNGKDYVKTYIVLPCALVLFILITCIAYIIYRKKRTHVKTHVQKNPEAMHMKTAETDALEPFDDTKE